MHQLGESHVPQDQEAGIKKFKWKWRRKVSPEEWTKLRRMSGSPPRPLRTQSLSVDQKEGSRDLSRSSLELPWLQISARAPDPAGQPIRPGLKKG